MKYPHVDPAILELCKHVTAKRPRTVIDHILRHGQVTTEELKELYGYNHPPRAARDVREQGVPLDTTRMTSAKTGKKVAVYKFGDPARIKMGRIGGRQAFSKKFRDALVSRYGERDAITSQPVELRYLQIDHRVPYEVAGDNRFDERNPDAYMLLDASSQRSKSWACEQCENWKKIRDVKICEDCYWAFPETYSHIALEPVRRLDIQWIGNEVAAYEALEQKAQSDGVPIRDFAKRLLSE